MENNGIKRYSLSKQVADQLEDMIENGKFEIGQKIPTEADLMATFNVSRNTIREAIQSLTSAGILVVKQGDGTYVTSNNRFEANMRMKYEKVTLKDIAEARNSLEVTIAILAAQRRTSDDIKLIREKLKERKNSTDTSKENTLADIQFHLAIAKACHNQIIIDLYKSLFSFLVSHIEERNTSTELNIKEIDDLHERLYEAILEMKSDEAASLVGKILEI